MNAPDINRSILQMHIAAIEAEYPLKILGLLPRGAAAHVFGDDALDFLAEKRPGLSLTSLTGAEIDLSKRLKRPVGIVLKSELRGREAQEVLAEVEPL
jgi:predicted nucleotidyltransferase